MFPFKSEAIADKRTTNPLQSEEKKECTYCKSHWTCFKANNSVSLIGYRSSQTHVSIKNCLSRKRRNGRESRTRFNFPDHPDRVQTDVAICLRRSADLLAIVSQTYADHMETRLNAAVFKQQKTAHEITTCVQNY